MRPEIVEAVRGILRDQIGLPTDVDTLSEDSDLFRAGLTSHASVNLMLALEAAFDIEFPDEMLKRSTFETVASICEAVANLQAREVAA
jgi:acyl carrier protein